MDNTNLIFVGFELTAEVQAQFDSCKAQDKDYLDNAEHLETVQIEGAKYVGKRVEGAIAVDRIEDMARSVVSLLGRVCSDWSFGPDQAIVLAAEKGEPIPSEGPANPPEGFDYSGLLD